MLRLTLLLAASLALPAATHADVYKYTDEHGNVQYTDKPPSLPAERMNVQSRRTDTVELAKRAEADQQRLAEQNKTRQGAQASQADAQQAQELSATDKAERCTKARERYDSYMTSQRLYELGPDGERRYLTDAELDATRTAAKASMDALCQ